jgi:acetyl esterase
VRHEGAPTATGGRPTRDHLTAHGLVLEMLAGPLAGIYDPTAGRMLFGFFAAMAETERENIREASRRIRRHRDHYGFRGRPVIVKFYDPVTISDNRGMSDAITTTGQDLAAETRAFNEALADLLAKEPQIHEVDDPAATRAARESGAGPFPAPVRLPEGINRTVPGRAGGIPVRVFTPPQVDGVYLHLHGGGWTLGSADAQDPLLWALARAARLAVVSVDYRLAPEHPYPAGPDDCEDAARWLTGHSSAEFGTDRLSIGGESAGAHLAVLTLLRLRDNGGLQRAFRAAHLAFGAYDASLTPSSRLWGDRNLVLSTPIMAWFWDQFLPGLDPEQRRDPGISPLYADLRDLPAARFMVGTQDPLLDDTLFMAARWRAAGNTADLEVVAEAAHGFQMSPITIAEQERARHIAYLAAAVA